MNRYSINSAAINGGAIVGTVVYLPSATATIQRTLSERVSIKLTGTLTSSWSVDGDISKVAVIGSVGIGITFEPSGTLAKFQRVYFDPVNVQVNWAPTGALATRKRLSNAVATKILNVTGKLNPQVVLKGTTGITLNTSATLHTVVRMSQAKATIGRALSGNVTLTGGLKVINSKSLSPSGNLAIGKRNPIPAATTVLSIVPQGALRGTFRFQGQSQKAWTLTAGDITRTKRLQGTGVIETTINGDLSNNAASVDLESVLMRRSKTEREMTR